MYNASDLNVNAQISNNVIMNRKAEQKIIICKYINENLFCYIMSCCKVKLGALEI